MKEKKNLKVPALMMVCIIMLGILSITVAFSYAQPHGTTVHNGLSSASESDASVLTEAQSGAPAKTLAAASTETAASYRVLFDSNGGSALENVLVSYGGTITEPKKPVKSNSVFGGWYENADFSGEEVVFPYTPIGNTILHAKWTAAIQSVTLISNGATIGKLAVAHGENVRKLTTPVREGYVFLGWYYDSACSSPVTLPVKIKSDIVLYADWVEEVSINVSYSYEITGLEFGAAVKKIIFDMGGEIASGDVNKNMLTFVTEETTTDYFGNTNVTEHTKTITDAYLSDETGAKTETASSEYVTFEFYIGYDGTSYAVLEGGNALDSSTDDGWKDLSIYAKSIKFKNLKVDGETVTGSVKATYDTKFVPDIKDWRIDKYIYEGYDDGGALETPVDTQIGYAAYETDALKNDGVANPLVIWLHGAGEGGYNPEIAILGNEVTAISRDEIQDFFRIGDSEGAYILAPQATDMWMRGIYATALKDTIDKYIALNGDIDMNRIYIGGCSNGGYMTVDMILKYPTFFAAAYPICEAYTAEITDTQLNAIKNLPIWFTHSADDWLVGPANTSVALYTRLIKAGAANTHFTYVSTVQGKDLPGVTYFGHWSWITMLNNDCTLDQDAAGIIADTATVSAPSSVPVKIGDKAVSIWEWIAAQSKA